MKYLKRPVAYHKIARNGLPGTIRTYIKVPIKILTPKIAENKQDSIFYAGKNIAEVKIHNRTYVLTTAGEYTFSLEENEGCVSFESCNMVEAWLQGKLPGRKPPRNFTDTKIKALGDKDLIENWGWFGINVWDKTPTLEQSQPGHFQIIEKETCRDTPTEVWSEYDEALSAFIEFVEKDLASNG